MEEIKKIIYNKEYSLKELSQLIDKYLIPQELEKKTNAEVSTPYKLRQEMLDKIPKKFWKKKRKVFEPCAGKGGFIIDIIERFMEGLKDKYPNEKKRYKRIIENCIYFSDINPTNIFICKLLIDPYNEYKKNYNEGDTLKIVINEKWKIEGFDAVIGNPPYTRDKKNIRGQGGTNLWIEFCKRGIEELKEKGYLLYIHPPLWRKPYINTTKNSRYYREMMKYNILCIKTYDKKQAKKYMNVGTRLDYYLLQKKKYEKKTIFIDYNGRKYTINLENFKYIPNAYLEIFEKIFKKCKEGIKAYKNAKTLKSGKEYPFIQNLTNSRIKKKYEKKKHIYHEEKKILFSDTEFPKFIYDKGEYGPTSHICYILKDNDKIINYLNSKIVRFIIKHSKYSTFQTDWEIFHYIPDEKKIYGKTDDELYEFFNLNQNEINIIEKEIK